MGYVKTIWQNGKTPLNADNMNHIEDGIEAASAIDIDLETQSDLDLRDLPNPALISVKGIDDDSRLPEGFLLVQWKGPKRLRVAAIGETAIYKNLWAIFPGTIPTIGNLFIERNKTSYQSQLYKHVIGKDDSAYSLILVNAEPNPMACHYENGVYRLGGINVIDRFNEAISTKGTLDTEGEIVQFTGMWVEEDDPNWPGCLMAGAMWHDGFWSDRFAYKQHWDELSDTVTPL